MDFHDREVKANLESYDVEDIFDYNASDDPSKDFIISIVEGYYEIWLAGAYSGS